MLLTGKWIATVALVAATFGVAGSLAGQDTTQKKVFVLPHVLEALSGVIDQPVPARLSAEDQKTCAAQTDWLKTVRNRVEALGMQNGVLAPRDVASGQATGRRQYSPPIFRKDLAVLQQTVEKEAQPFNSLSGVLKTRHDIAMNAIRNMK
jgi:hypothetical protein